MGKVRLYRRDDTLNTVGIPAEGELYEAEDAERLVGQGLATRRPPTSGRKGKSKQTPPAPPAQEG